MKKLTSLILVLGLIMMSQGCDDLLDNPAPSTSIAQDVALNDPGAVQALRASLYSRLHSFAFTTLSMLGPDPIADNTSNASGTSRFQGLAQNQLRAGLSAWGATYNLVLDANMLIGGIPDAADIDLTQDQIDQYQGEAYILRAYAMHYLTRTLGYDPGALPPSGPGAGWDKAIILRTEPTLTASDADERARSTIEQVYTQIESDLQQGISLLDGINNTADRFFVTKAFGQGILARVYLYWKKHASAVTMAENAIATTNATLANSQAAVTAMFDETAGINPETLFTVRINPDTESQGVNSSLAAYTATVWNAQVPTQDLLDLYDMANDYRVDAWYAPCFSENFGSSCVNEAQDVNTPGWEVQKWNGEKGKHTDDVPLMRLAELKLIIAEADARDNGIVTAKALTNLNDLRQARGLGTVATTDFATPGEFYQEILDERRREFVVEGHRFFDLKRLGLPIKKAVGRPDILFTSFKVLDNVPSSELEVNSKLEQNPGYSE